MKCLIAPNVDGSLKAYLEQICGLQNGKKRALSSLWTEGQKASQGQAVDIGKYVRALEDAQVNSPRCIIQQVRYTEFQLERDSHFLTTEGDVTCSNPLLYRRAKCEYDKDDKAIEKFRNCSLPIIFIGDFALFKDQESGPDDRQDNQEARRSARLELPEAVYPPGGNDKLFLDSSIWHRYVPIWELDRLPDIIKEMEDLSRRGVYQTTVALEDLDYSIRMLRNQYVEDFDRGHGRQIGVHTFHSEGRTATAVRGATWPRGEKTQLRILLVDDYAKTSLRSPERNGEKQRTKEACVRRVLQGLTDVHIEIELKCAVDFEDALAELEHERYDLILLDYLFTIDSKEQPRSVPLYGSDFLKKLTTSDPEKLRPGPGGKFWVMPATVFPEAIGSEVDSANVSQNEAEYTLFSGADPVCTPELFKYKFLKMVETITNEITPSVTPFVKLLVALEKRQQEETLDVRSECRRAFHQVVGQCGRYIGLQEDEKDSPLAKWILNQEMREVGELLVRIRSFLNDFVYGGNQKWATLHLEYDFFSRHPLLLKEEDKSNSIEKGLGVLLKEINRKAERG